MRITGFRLGVLRIPLRTPFKTALRTVSDIEDAVLCLETDTGHRGYGEAPPTVAITGDSLESIIKALHEVIAPALIGQDCADIVGNCRIIQACAVKNSSAKAAAEIAVYDLAAQLAGQPLYRFLGGGNPELATDLTISVNDTATMLTDCETALQRGFKALKIKVGKSPETDIARLAALHSQVNGRAKLRIDANQGWTVAQTLQVMQALEAQTGAFELLEQPVPASDIQGLMAIKSAGLLTPLMADESAFNLEQVEQLLELRAVDIINIKLMKTAGISQAIAIAETCHAHGIPCLMGSMLEGAISVAAAAHLAVAKAHAITLVDLDGPSLGQFNPIDGNTVFDEAVIRLSDRAGLGITSISHVTWLD
mgnify:CR=1 FL=1